MATQLAEHCDRFKWDADGAKSMQEVADRLKATAKHYADLVDQGADLLSDVDNGYVFYTLPGHTIEVETDEDSRTCLQCQCS